MDLEAVANAADEFRERIRELEDYIVALKDDKHSLEDEMEAERKRHKGYRDGIRDIVAELHGDTIPKNKLSGLAEGDGKQVEAGADARIPESAEKREPLEI